jgi:hypothetical protein
MRSFEDDEGVTVAVAQGREAIEAGGAQIIDLIQLPSGSRPRPFAGIEVDEVQAFRLMDCDDYGACLSFAARVRWRSFSCKTCPRFVQARRAAQHDDATGAANLAAVIRLR